MPISLQTEVAHGKRSRAAARRTPWASAEFITLEDLLNYLRSATKIASFFPGLKMFKPGGTYTPCALG